MRAAAPVLLLAGALAAAPARAAPTSRLTYVRGPGAEKCPDEAELRRAVAERLGYDPFFPAANRTIVAEITRTPNGYAARLAVLDAGGVSIGERTLPTATRDCGEVVKSLALAISIAIDDLDAARPPPPEPAPAPEPPAPPPAPPPADEPTPPPPKPPEPPPRRLWFGAELGVLGAAASAPAPALGGVLGVRAIGPWWALALEGRADLPASDAIAGGGTVASHLTLGALGACAWTGEAWRPEVCLVAALGSFDGTTRDVTSPRSASALYVGAGARVGVEAALAGPLYAFGRIGALGALTPHRALLNGAVVYTLPSVSGEVALGVGVRIP